MPAVEPAAAVHHEHRDGDLHRTLVSQVWEDQHGGP
jgi:hypothetical protein